MRGFLLLTVSRSWRGSADPPYCDEPVPLSEVGPPTVPFGSPVFVLFVAPELPCRWYRFFLFPGGTWWL